MASVEWALVGSLLNDLIVKPGSHAEPVKSGEFSVERVTV
jgi:hypothetical protein